MTTNDISTALGSAKLYYINQLARQLPLMQKGVGTVRPLVALQRLIRGLTFQLNANVIDDTTDALYSCLTGAIAGFTGNYIPNPDVIITGQSIIVIQPNTLVELIQKSQDDLLLDSVSGNYYLPFLDQNGDQFTTTTALVGIAINGVGRDPQPNYSFTPIRIYGVDDKSVPQVIVMIVVTTAIS